MRSLALLFLLLAAPLTAADEDIYAEVNFSNHLQLWEGFGVNYVETCQTPNYSEWPQEYGGFSTLSEDQRQEILRLIFSEDGLKPGIVKMFLDPFHEGMTVEGNDNDDPWSLDQSKFDHETTTQWMRYFVRQGLDITRSRGGDLEIITTLYGPPGWTTKQGFIRGRDLDPAMKYEIGEYLAAWLLYLRDVAQFPVKYVSLHNEGEARNRWPADGSHANWKAGHDYNMYWSPEQVVDFLQFLRPMLDHFGLQDIGVTPGETTNWRFFTLDGFGAAIAADPVAFRNMAIVTSHSFGSQAVGGVDTLRWRATRPPTARDNLRVWVTSTSWSKMTVDFISAWTKDLYDIRINALIPWAVVQTDTWVGGDPNPGTAFRVDRKGGWNVEPGYFYYKQISRAGQPGMRVADVLANDDDIKLMAFAGADTDNPDAFVVMNTSETEKTFRLQVKGSEHTAFAAWRTSPTEQYQSQPAVPVRDGYVQITAPARSATTFFGQ